MQDRTQYHNYTNHELINTAYRQEPPDGLALELAIRLEMTLDVHGWDDNEPEVPA